ncbi:acyltransferase [Catenovulum sp. 2E275]|uniref:acyltransferase family protein n=1 Tax=Catenovulum sp. 2E275 TaxID=2980497 RepID=UPI0021D3C002|nr:acyltransferase [Catenovulum sp. 2E275]MCU4674822.1 acyltransferase [Catenovulum sp. 2E275]
MSRYLWVDNAKAIAIFLVVLGHFAALHGHVKTLIYVFHLPVFLFLTGFLVSAKLKSSNLDAFNKHYLSPYLRLYLGFSLLSILLWMAIVWFNSGQMADVFTALFASLYGVHGEQRWFIHGNGPLWYFPLLITSLAVFFLLLKLPEKIIMLLVSAYFIFSVSYQGLRLPWCFDIAGVAVFFMYLGALFKQHYQTLSPYILPQLTDLLTKKRIIVLVGIAFATVLWLYFTLQNGRSNLNARQFGENPLIYLFTAMFGTWLAVLVASWLPSNPVMQFLAKHTLIIFSTHIYFVKLCRMVDFPNGLAGLLWVGLAAAIVVGICSLLSRILEKPVNRYLLAK